MHYNIFNEVHRPLKLALLTACINLGKKNSFNLTDAVGIINKIDEVLTIFKEQVEIENTAVLPLIFEFEPSLWNCYLQQHEQQLDQLQKLEGLIHTFRTLHDEIEQFAVMIFIDEAFNAFLLNNYHHMDDEEEILNKVLWQYYSDDYLQQVQQGKRISLLCVRILGIGLFCILPRRHKLVAQFL